MAVTDVCPVITVLTEADREQLRETGGVFGTACGLW